MLATEVTQVAWDTMICIFLSTGFPLQGSNSYKRTWSNGDTSVVTHIHQEGTYWVTYRTGYCDTRIDTFKIKGGMPEAVIVRNNNLLSTTATYNTYQWYKAGIVLPGVTGQTRAISVPGWYSVKVSGAYSCTDSTTYYVSSLGVDDLQTLKNNIRIFPNPATNKVFIQSPVPLKVTLLDMSGRIVLPESAGTQLDVSHIASGSYMLQLKDKEHGLIKTEKLVVKPGE